MLGKMVGGTGCTSRNDGLGLHNPEPSTARGNRRHEARNEEQRAHAVRMWAKPRSNKPRCRPGNKSNMQPAAN